MVFLRKAPLLGGWRAGRGRPRDGRRAPAAERGEPQPREDGEAPALADVDSECALQQPRRVLARDAEHGMQYVLPGQREAYSPVHRQLFQSQVSNQVLHRDMVRFYDRAVKPLMDHQGSAEYAPIPGSLYRFLALKEFGYGSGLFQIKDAEKRSPFFMKGLQVVIAIQWIGPAALAYYCFYTMLSTDRFVSLSEVSPMVMAENFGFSKFMRIVLGFLFLVLFCLNGLYVMETDIHTNKRIMHMIKVFESVASRDGLPMPQTWWMYLGAAVNCWCLILCACCMWPAFIISEDGVKDILFDALALTFLYNLDDVSGDLSFLEDQWDEDMIGEIYGKMAEEPDLEQSLKDVRESEFTPDNLYMQASKVMTVLTWTLPAAFVITELLEKADAGGG